jgi:hypothetical protein
VAAKSKAWVCSLSLAGIMGFSTAGDMDVCLLWALCVVRQKFLQWADLFSGGVLPSVVCLSVVVKPRQRGGPEPLGLSGHKKKIVTPYDKRCK